MFDRNGSRDCDGPLLRRHDGPDRDSVDLSGHDERRTERGDDVSVAPVGANYVWSAARGSIRPAGETSAFYTAPASGTDTVTVSAGNRSATASVVVLFQDWIGQPQGVTPTTGTFASGSAVSLAGIPYVRTSDQEGITACFTRDGIDCTGDLGFGINLGVGSGVTQIGMRAPTTTSPTLFKQVLLFMHPFGSCTTTTTCANYAETVSIDLTITP